MILETISSMADSALMMLDIAARNHYTNGQMARYVVEGLRQLYSIRPSSRLNEKGIVDVEFPTDDAELLDFKVRINEDRWRYGIVCYAAGLAHEVGVTDSVNLQLAQKLKKQAAEVFVS